MLADSLPLTPPTVVDSVSNRILIVDDNADLAEAMSMVLSLSGFQTTTAYSGRLALEKARTFHPEIVLLDVGLPDIDGGQVASTIREELGMTAPPPDRHFGNQSQVRPLHRRRDRLRSLSGQTR